MLRASLSTKQNFIGLCGRPPGCAAVTVAAVTVPSTEGLASFKHQPHRSSSFFRRKLRPFLSRVMPGFLSGREGAFSSTRLGGILPTQTSTAGSAGTQ